MDRQKIKVHTDRQDIVDRQTDRQTDRTQWTASRSRYRQTDT